MRRAGFVVALVVIVSSSCSILPTREVFSDAGTGGTGGTGGAGGGTAGAGGGTGGSAGHAGAGGSVAGAGGASTDGGGADVNPCLACMGATPVCLQGSCVQCVASSDCNKDATKPICEPTSHTCVACSSDSQCASKLGPTGNPGVCLSNVDGRCATDSETVYVQNSSSCAATYGSGGTATVPYCSLEPVGLAANATHTVVVIRGPVNAPSWTYQRGPGQSPTTSFIGQQSALIASGTTPGFNMDSGNVYFRGVKFSSLASICIQATGGTLDLDTDVVDSCASGGIYLNGAAFNIINTTVTNNGPGTMGTTTWGGILISSISTTGPAVLKLDTVEMNKGPGVSCSGQVMGTGVYATGNSSVDIATSTCGFSSCSPVGTTCGAQ